MNSSLCEYVQFQRPFVGEIPIHSLTKNAGSAEWILVVNVHLRPLIVIYDSF